MTVINSRYEQFEAGFADLSFASLFADYVGESRLRARNLAMLQLMENCGWDLPQIMAFTGLSKPAVSLAIRKTKRELAQLLTGSGSRGPGTGQRECRPERERPPRKKKRQPRQREIAWPAG